MVVVEVIKVLTNALLKNFIGWLFLLISIGLTIMLLTFKVKGYVRKRKYLIRKNPSSLLKKATKIIVRVVLFDKILSYIAIRISVLNDNSYEKNKEKSVAVLFLIIVLIIVSLVVVLPSVKIIWYLYLFYLILSIVFILCILYTIQLILRMYFTKLLPDAYKILNSRFTTEGDILKAIDKSLVDFDPAIRREMTRIRNVLRKNDGVQINNTFRQMEMLYKNEYFTLLLNLIQQAYYKGGKESIKSQFEMVTEEILIDIENQKDLALTSRMYVVISLFLPLGVKWLEGFNQRALGQASVDFYGGPIGVGFKILMLVSLLLYIVSLLFLERTA